MQNTTWTIVTFKCRFCWFTGQALVDIIMICAKTDSGQYGRPIVALERSAQTRTRYGLCSAKQLVCSRWPDLKSLNIYVERKKWEFYRMNLDKFVRPDGPGVVCAWYPWFNQGHWKLQARCGCYGRDANIDCGTICKSRTCQSAFERLLAGIFDGTKDMDGLTLRYWW